MRVSVFKTFLSSEDSIKSPVGFKTRVWFFIVQTLELIKYEESSGNGNGGFTWRQSFATKVGRKGPNGVSLPASLWKHH